MIPALLLLQTLIHGSFQIPKGEWRFVDAKVVRASTSVVCEFEVTAGSPVRAAILRRSDLDHYPARRDTLLLAATSFDTSGKLRYLAREPADYVVLVETRQRSAAQLNLRIALESPRNATTLPPERRFTVIAISLGVFVGIITFAAVRLVPQWKKRPEGE
ncbi:MAG: hypothetical protein ACRD8O_08185 [Bryobacteraceae bacterium]